MTCPICSGPEPGMEACACGRVRNLLFERMRRTPPRSQEECCENAVRQSIAQFGPMVGDEMIRAASLGLAQGLFDEACTDAHIEMAERAYRRVADSETAPQGWLGP